MVQDFFLIALVCAFIVDVSGFSDTVLSVATFMSRKAGGGEVESLPPLTCSTCAAWWTSLFWSLHCHGWAFPGWAEVALCALCALCAHPLGVLLRRLQEFVYKVFTL